MALTASLPMYDLPVLRPAAEAVWRSMAGALRRTGLDRVPASLTWGPTGDLWRDRNLLFSQTCGHPLVHGFAGRLRPVATPRYRAAGCDGSLYRSAVVVRQDSDFETLADCRDRICAVNGWDSLSGWHALAALVASLAQGGRFFTAARLTGGHEASVQAVAAGDADLAAIDAVTWAHIGHHRPDLSDTLRVLAWTQPAPGLPFVTSADAEDQVVRRLRDAVFAMLADDHIAEHRATLLIAGAELLDIGDYACVRLIAEKGASFERPPLMVAGGK